MLKEFFKNLFRKEPVSGSLEEYLKTRDAKAAQSQHLESGQAAPEWTPSLHQEKLMEALADLEATGTVERETLKDLFSQLQGTDAANITTILSSSEDNLSGLENLLEGFTFIAKNQNPGSTLQNARINIKTTVKSSFSSTIRRNGQDTTIKTASLLDIPETLPTILTEVLRRYPEVLSAYLFQMAENSDALQPAIGVKLSRNASRATEAEVNTHLLGTLETIVGASHGYRVLFFREEDPADDMLEKAMDRVTAPFLKVS